MQHQRGLHDSSAPAVLITGVEQAVAADIATTVAEFGRTVVVHGFTAAAADRVAAGITDRGCLAHPVEADLTAPGGVEAMFSGLTDAGLRVGALVHAAALPGLETVSRPLADIHPSEWQRFIHQHLTMLLLTVQAAATAMTRTPRRGVIVTVSAPSRSTGGRVDCSTLARDTVNGAVEAFTARLAHESAAASLAVTHLRCAPDAALPEAQVDDLQQLLIESTTVPASVAQ